MSCAGEQTRNGVTQSYCLVLYGSSRRLDSSLALPQTIMSTAYTELALCSDCNRSLSKWVWLKHTTYNTSAHMFVHVEKPRGKL